jgi:hypothetical protein
MVAMIVQKLGVMHLVLGTKSYKTTFGTITMALGRITNLPIN